MGEGETSYLPGHILSGVAWKTDIIKALEATPVELPPINSLEDRGKHDYHVFEINTSNEPLFLGIYNSISYADEPFRVSLYSLQKGGDIQDYYRSSEVTEIRVSKSRDCVIITGDSEILRGNKTIREIIVYKSGKIVGYDKDDSEQVIKASS
jgi:hypothetical protein